MSGIIIAFAAFFIGLLIGGFAKSTKRREHAFRKVLKRKHD